MNEFFHKIRQMFFGKRMPDVQTKMKVLYMGITGIHLFYTIVFGVEQIRPLFLYNTIVTAFYLYHRFISLRKEQYHFMYVSSEVEILTHATLATLLLGWDWGFAMYCMAVIPATFYFNYILKQLKGRLHVPIVSAMVVSAFFIIIRAVTDHVAPLYHGTYSDNLQSILYYFNVVMSLGLLVFFSSLFAMEIKYMQRKLEQENLQLGQIANYDPLTQMMNRRSMNIQLKAAHDAVEINGKPFCVMLIDLDDFKKVDRKSVV